MASPPTLLPAVDVVPAVLDEPAVLLPPLAVPAVALDSPPSPALVPLPAMPPPPPSSEPQAQTEHPTTKDTIAN
jgi:hypothetical protein